MQAITIQDYLLENFVFHMNNHAIVYQKGKAFVVPRAALLKAENVTTKHTLIMDCTRFDSKKYNEPISVPLLSIEIRKRSDAKTSVEVEFTSGQKMNMFYDLDKAESGALWLDFIIEVAQQAIALQN